MWVFYILREVENTEKNLSQDIKNIEKDILKIENKIVEFAQNYQKENVRKSLGELRIDLKYLSVLTNGQEIDENEHREIMDFLRIHYNYLQEKTSYSKDFS